MGGKTVAWCVWGVVVGGVKRKAQQDPPVRADKGANPCTQACTGGQPQNRHKPKV